MTVEQLFRVENECIMHILCCFFQEVIDDYFNLLKDTLDSLELVGKLHCIYNMDEKGMPLEAKQLKRVAPKGIKRFMGDHRATKHKSPWLHIPVLQEM